MGISKQEIADLVIGVASGFKGILFGEYLRDQIAGEPFHVVDIYLPKQDPDDPLFDLFEQRVEEKGLDSCLKFVQSEIFPTNKGLAKAAYSIGRGSVGIAVNLYTGSVADPCPFVEGMDA